LTDRFLIPTFVEEEQLLGQGYRHIAGVDEVGCGPLAGPLLAAAVILPYPLQTSWVDQVRDSKFLTSDKREELSEHIRKVAVSIGIGAVSAELIDKEGLTHARRMAMKSSIDQLMPPADYVLIDYLLLPGLELPQKGVINGDSLCLSIACASIVAKVARDHMMIDLDRVYPGYGFARHKGYGTRQHIECLTRLGPSPAHRSSFQPVRDVMKI
jgi:ribonuclease HII